MSMGHKIEAQILLADIQDERLTILFFDGYNHKIFTTTHIKPRTLKLPNNLKEDLNGKVL